MPKEECLCRTRRGETHAPLCPLSDFVPTATSGPARFRELLDAAIEWETQRQALSPPTAASGRDGGGVARR